MYALKRHDLIFITGQSGSAKSSLIRLVERTINKQMSTVNVSELKDFSRFFCIFDIVESIKIQFVGYPRSQRIQFDSFFLIIQQRCKNTLILCLLL